MTDMPNADRAIGLIHQRLDEHGHRIRDHGERIGSIEMRQATQAVQIAHIDSRLTEIQTGIRWIIQLVIGGIVMGMIAFVIAGGLNVGP